MGRQFRRRASPGNSQSLRLLQGLSAHHRTCGAGGDESTVTPTLAWTNSIIADEDLSLYLDNHSRPSWPARAAALIAQQRQTWPLLSEGLASLSAVETRTV